MCGKSGLTVLATVVVLHGTGLVGVVSASDDASVYGEPVRASHFAGSTGGPGYTDGSASSARFNSPKSVAVDAAGVVYVADSGNHTIRKIAPNGIVSTLAGMAGVPGSADGRGSEARFAGPRLTVGPAGTIYVADTSNHTVRAVTASGEVTTLAGLSGVSGTEDGIGSAARFYNPQGIAVDRAGIIYVADYSGTTLRKVTPDGVVSTLAGRPGVRGDIDGTGSTALFFRVAGLDVGPDGNIYVSDGDVSGGRNVRVVTPGGTVSMLVRDVGGGGLTLDSYGNIYLAIGFLGGSFGREIIRVVTPAGSVTTLAGLSGAVGSDDGTGSEARFNLPSDVAVDGSGRIYVADSGNNAIRLVTREGVVTTVAGSAVRFGSVDDAGGLARFNYPQGPSVDREGNVYVADTFNHTIRRISTAGMVTTVAGLPGSPGSEDGVGSSARFNGPTAVAVDQVGYLFVADQLNHTIRQVSPGGVVSTLAGSPGASGTSDGTGSAARFARPSGIAVGPSGVIYVADYENHTIRQVSPAGVVTTLAGSPRHDGSSDGTGTAARFFWPSGLAVDSSGNLYVADETNATIRRVTPEGAVTTIAGMVLQRGSDDGVGSAARFNYPNGVALDGVGNVFVTDGENHTIRKLTAAGSVTTVAGMAGNVGCENGTGREARFNGPSGVTVDIAGNIYVAERGNHAIRKIEPYTCGTPSAPKLSGPTSATSGTTYRLSWSSTSPDEAYELQESTDSTFAGAATEAIIGTSHETSHASTAPITWYARVRAVQSCNGTTYRSEWSNVSRTSIGPRQRPIRPH